MEWWLRTAPSFSTTPLRPIAVRGINVAYFPFERLPKPTTPTGVSRTPPNGAVEVVGKGQGWCKMTEKAAEYLTMGVDRVWIVDPEKQRVCVLRADIEPQSFGTREEVRRGGAASFPL